MTWSFPHQLTAPRGWVGVGDLGPQVLLIEDDRSIAEMYRLQLQVDGFQVRVAADGRAGLQALRERLPELVLLDLRLPQQDGFDVLREIGADPALAGLTVVILSNYGDATMIARGLQLGARDYLVKSQTTPSDLSARVRGWLDGPPRSD